MILSFSTLFTTGEMLHQKIRAILVVAFTELALITVVVATSPTARADGNCAYVGNGVVCMNVRRDLFDQQRVIDVSIQRTSVIPPDVRICNYTASDLSVTTPGVPYPSIYPPRNPPKGQCVPGAAEIGYPAYKIPYPAPGTTFCAQWFEDDKPIGTVVCEQ